MHLGASEPNGKLQLPASEPLHDLQPTPNNRTDKITALHLPGLTIPVFVRLQIGCGREPGRLGQSHGH